MLKMLSTDPIYFLFPVWMLYQSVPAGQLHNLFSTTLIYDAFVLLTALLT